MQNSICSILTCGSVGREYYEPRIAGGAFALIYCLRIVWFAVSEHSRFYNSEVQYHVDYQSER